MSKNATDMDSSMVTSPMDPDQARLARKMVMRRALDPGDETQLLAMLGISDEPSPPPSGDGSR